MIPPLSSSPKAKKEENPQIAQIAQIAGKENPQITRIPQILEEEGIALPNVSVQPPQVVRRLRARH